MKRTRKKTTKQETLQQPTVAIKMTAEDKAAAEKKGGTIFDKKSAQLFRKNILERGGTEPAMDLYKRFRGGEPTINALLERDGIKVIPIK